MSFLGSMFSNDKGAGFQGTGANIQDPTNPNQIAQTYGQAQGALNQQQNFVNAVNAQNGLGNQSAVYNQLAGVANGTGPNPAQAALNQATGQNVANQAALMAGQRGASANPGLIARQAAMQGANIQQQAAGQGANLQAQQSLNAIDQMGGIANQQAAQQAGAIQGLNQAAQSEQGQILGAQGTFNNQAIANQGNLNNVNAGIANTNAQGQWKTSGGVLNGIAGATGLFAEGGMVPKYAGGGPVSNVGQFLYGGNPGVMAAPQVGEAKFTNLPDFAQPKSQGSTPPSAPSKPAPGPAMAKGGKVPAMVSPGERYLPPEEVAKVAQGKEDPMKAGEKIPGKAKVKGKKDSYKNDTVHAMLDAGGIVIPRHITQGEDAPKKAAEFVAAVLAHQGLKR